MEPNKISTQSANQLSTRQVERWRHIQADNPELSSGLFSVELVQAIAEVRPSIEVGVLSHDDQPVGFFPFERTAGDVAVAPAGPLADLQGAIMPATLAIDPRRLLRDCGLVAWNFNHLLACQAAFRPFHVISSLSPYMDLSQGFQAYSDERRQAGSDELRETMRKRRKIEREIGKVRFEAHAADEEILDVLLRWKAEQLSRTRRGNSLTAPWVRALLARLIRMRSEMFAGMLSALYVSDTLVAATVGVRSQCVLQGWITAFDRRFSKFSPGLILLTELAQAAEQLGIRRIDMGKGPEPFKRSFQSGSMALAEGSVDVHVMAGVLKQNWLRTREWVKTTSLAVPARRLVDRVRTVRGE